MLKDTWLKCKASIMSSNESGSSDREERPSFMRSNNDTGTKEQRSLIKTGIKSEHLKKNNYKS